MPRYMVAITEIVEYLVPVIARNEEDAETVALTKIIGAPDRDKWCVGVRERDVEGIEPANNPSVSA